MGGKGPQSGTPTVFPSPDLHSFFGFMPGNRLPDPVRSDRTKGSPRRGSLREVRQGVWEIRWEEKHDPESGKRVRRRRRVEGNRTKADRVLTAELKRVDADEPAERRDLTLGQWLDDWLRIWCHGVSERTRHSYRGAIRSYVPEGLRRRRLAALSPSELQRLLNDMSDRGLSPRTVQMTRTVLRAAVGRAVKLGYVRRNVVALTEAPQIVKKEMRYLTPEQTRRFIAAAVSDRWTALWVLLVTTGLRPGEALGLKWGDLDGEKLRVQRALVRVPGSGWSLAEPKNKKGRTVTLPAVAQRPLRRLQAEERLRLGAAYSDQGFMFATASGQPLDATNLKKKHFKPLLERAGLPAIRLYDLRHTAASLLLANGEHPKVVQEMLGHFSITLTMDTYSHVMPDMQEQSAARLDVLLGGRSRSSSK